MGSWDEAPNASSVHPCLMRRTRDGYGVRLKVVDLLFPLVLAELVCQHRVVQSHQFVHTTLAIGPQPCQERHCSNCGIVH